MGLPKIRLKEAGDLAGYFLEPLFIQTLIIQVSRTKLDNKNPVLPQV
jgi:hypothetical protein